MLNAVVCHKIRHRIHELECLDADYLVRKLHGGDDIEHIRGFAHLFLIEKVKMGQAGAADKDVKPLIFIRF